MHEYHAKPIIWKQDPLAENLFMRMFKEVSLDSPLGGFHKITLYRHTKTDRHYVVIGCHRKEIDHGSFMFKEIDKNNIEYIIKFTIQQLLEVVDGEKSSLENG